MIRYTWQNHEQLPAYETQPPGPYFFKVMFAETGLQGGNGITAGSTFIMARIAISDKQGAILNQWKERFILHPNTAWKWEAFLRCINFRGGNIATGSAIEMQLRDIVGGRGKADIGVKPIENRKSQGSSVYVGQQQQSPDEVRYRNEVVRYHDNMGYPFDEKVRADFDAKMAAIEDAAKSQAAPTQNHAYPQGPAPSNAHQAPANSPFTKRATPQQGSPFTNRAAAQNNLGNQSDQGYPDPDLPSDDEIPF